MSHFCQFCDKEMKFKQSVVFVEDYITCGARRCADQARDTIQALERENIITQDKVVVFSTTTPEKPETWRPVPIEDHPEFMRNPEAVEMMLNGEIANLTGSDVYYSAKKSVDIQEDFK